jgi:hypothetical protein
MQRLLLFQGNNGYVYTDIACPLSLSLCLSEVQQAGSS